MTKEEFILGIKMASAEQQYLDKLAGVDEDPEFKEENVDKDEYDERLD